MTSKIMDGSSSGGSNKNTNRSQKTTASGVAGVSSKGNEMISKIKSSTDGIVKIYPISKTFNLGTSPMEALVVYDLATFAAMKVASGIPGKWLSFNMRAHFFANTGTNLNTTLPRIHLGILQTEYNATLTSNIEATSLHAAVFGMSDQDLNRYEELGVIQSKVLCFGKSDLSAVLFLERGEIEIDLLKVIEKMQREYTEAEMSGETAQLPKRAVVAVMEGDVDSISKTLNVTFETILQATKVPNFSKMT